MEEKDSKRADILVPRLIDEKKLWFSFDFII